MQQHHLSSAKTPSRDLIAPFWICDDGWEPRKKKMGLCPSLIGGFSPEEKKPETERGKHEEQNDKG